MIYQKNSVKKSCKHPTCGETCRRSLPEPKIISITPDFELKAWFDHRMKTCQPICANCGIEAKWVNKEPYLKLFKAAQAHLLPKRHFWSLKLHELNGMVLFAGYSGICNCHDVFDSSWDAASKMNIWEEVIRRFKIMYPLIPTVEHQFIPKQLSIHL